MLFDFVIIYCGHCSFSVMLDHMAERTAESALQLALELMLFAMAKEFFSYYNKLCAGTLKLLLI